MSTDVKIGSCTSIRCDCCYQNTLNKTNELLAQRSVHNFGKCDPKLDTTCPWMRPRQLYVGACNVNNESRLWSNPTNPRTINQLFPRIYKGPPDTSYGQGEVGNEDRVRQGQVTRSSKSCVQLSEINYDRFQPNLERSPQGVILPVDLKVGVSTRSMMKNSQYNKKCKSSNLLKKY
jgi:hypothetical protein